MFQQDIIQDANWYACQLTQCLWQASTLERHIMGSCRLEKCSWQTIEGQARIWFTCRLSGCNRPAAAAGRQLSPQRAGRMLVRRQRSDVGDLCRSAGAALRFRACDADHAQAQKARFSECAMNGAHWGAPADAGGVQGVRSGAGQHGAGRDAGSEPDGTAVDRRPATERPPAWGEASSRRKCAAYRRSVLECDRRPVCASTTGTAAIVVSTANRSKQICISPEESIRRSMPTPW